MRVLGRSGSSRPTAQWTLAAATPIAIEHGVWLRPFRNLIYAMPPFVCTPDEVEQITAAMVAVAGHVAPQ